MLTHAQIRAKGLRLKELQDLDLEAGGLPRSHTPERAASARSASERS